MSETIIPSDIVDEMRDSYMEYAMSVIVGRALPDVRDGLKPVHRRGLFVSFIQLPPPARGAVGGIGGGGACTKKKQGGVRERVWT